MDAFHTESNGNNFHLLFSPLHLFLCLFPRLFLLFVFFSFLTYFHISVLYVYMYFFILFFFFPLKSPSNPPSATSTSPHLSSSSSLDAILSALSTKSPVSLKPNQPYVCPLCRPESAKNLNRNSLYSVAAISHWAKIVDILSKGDQKGQRRVTIIQLFIYHRKNETDNEAESACAIGDKLAVSTCVHSFFFS